jgi:hypothetical protein
MSALNVSRMRVRYRVPAADPNVRKRLDAVLDRVLGDALEPALVLRGVPVSEEICVRVVRAPARLRLDDGERSAADSWSAAIADAISASVSSGGADVVRYRSRHAALADLALGVAEGRLARVWAWRRLGLWHGPEAPDARGRGAELTFALMSEPESVVAALVHVARVGALPELMHIVAREEWVELARAALAAGGASPRIVDVAVERELAQQALDAHPAVARAWSTSPATMHTSSASPPTVAAHVARTSFLARAAAGVEPIAAETAAALAVLAWLEADPAAVGAASVHRAVDVVLDVARRLAPRPALRQADKTVDVDAVDSVEDAIPPTVTEEAKQTAAQEIAEQRLDDQHAPEELASLQGDEATPGLSDESITADDGADAHDDVLPARALTSYGGLLFLLSVLDELDVPKAASRTAPLARRPLRWTLHRLALMLVPVALDDPAALAFAGLPPDAEPPGDDERQETDEERIALADIARQIEEHLVERLVQADIPRTELLDFVCRRRAEVVFDPGWLELCLPLDEVSVELRRAAIDLDPGWLPWLGVVVRFVYG